MKAFLLAMVAMVGISAVAAVALTNVPMSADQVNTTDNVRLH